MCVALWLISHKRINWYLALRDQPWLITLVVFMLISVVWSSMPATSFIRWIRELQAVIMALVLLGEPSPRRSLESLLRKCIYILLPISVLLIKYYPDFGIDYGRWTGERMWIGVAQQKNGLGLICLISVFYLSWSLATGWKNKNLRERKYEVYADIICLILALWLFRGPSGSFFYSATSFYSLFLGLLSYWAFRFLRKHKKLPRPSVVGVLAALIILAGISILFTQGSQIGFVAAAAGRSSTLTDRTVVWASLLPVAMKHPLLGYGFGGFWTPVTKKMFHIDSAHSGYLATLLSIGFLGLLLTALFLIAASRRLRELMNFDFDWGAFAVSFIFIALIHNIAESSFDSLTSLSTAIILFMTVSSVEMRTLRKS
jgi:exopolysaccharide production protein ExoQ